MAIIKIQPYIIDETQSFTFANVTSTGNLTSVNANLGNAVTSNYFIGNGSLLTGIGGTYSNADVANYLPTYTGNVAAGNVLTNNLLYANGVAWSFGTGTYSNTNVAAYLPTYTGNVNANYFIGNGSTLTSITGGNVTGQVANALIAGTVYTNAQPNITSVGTLSSLTVTGLITATGTGIKTSNVQDSSGTVTIQTGYGNSAGDVGIYGNLTVGTSGTGNITAYNANLGNLVIGNFLQGTLTTQAQPNITSVGTLTSLTVTGNSNSGNVNTTDVIASGNATITGNLTVGGTTTYVNVTTLAVKDPIIELGGGTNNAPLTTNDGKDRGTLLHYYTSTTVDAFMGWDNSNGEFAFGSNVSVSSDVVTFNSFGNIRASYFLGNGSQLTGTIANANYALYAGTVTTNAQPNITSVGTLTSLSVTGNISSGNANLGNLVTANFVSGTLTTNAQPNITSVGTLSSLTITSNVSANYFIGNGSTLTDLTGSNVTGQVANALISGTVYTNSQPNITSVGTLTGLTVSGNLSFTGANAYFSNISNVHIPGGSANYVIITDGTGNLSWAAQSGGGGNGTPGGSNTQLQFNDANSFSGAANVTYDKTTNTLSVTGNATFSGANVSLGNVSNLKITGGSSSQYLQTDGTGNLTWTTGTSALNTITVDTFTGNGVQTSFTLSVSPSNVNDTTVNYNGATLLRNSYSINGANIDFSSAPANGSSIEVTTVQLAASGPASFTTRTATGNGSTVNYTVSSGATVSSVIVTLDGVVQTPTTDYTVAGTTLTFTTAPDVGVAIQIRELGIAISTTAVTTGKSIAMAIVFGF